MRPGHASDDPHHVASPRRGQLLPPPHNLLHGKSKMAHRERRSQAFNVYIHDKASRILLRSGLLHPQSEMLNCNLWTDHSPSPSLHPLLGETRTMLVKMLYNTSRAGELSRAQFSKNVWFIFWKSLSNRDKFPLSHENVSSSGYRSTIDWRVL